MLPLTAGEGSVGQFTNVKYEDVSTFLIEYDLVYYGLDSQNVPKFVVVNDFWRIESGVLNYTIRGVVFDQRTDNNPLFGNEPPELRPCQGWQCWRAFLQLFVVARRICRGPSWHEVSLMMLVVGLVGLWLRLCSPVARSMYPTLLVEE